MYIVNNVAYSDAGKYLYTVRDYGYSIINNPEIQEFDVIIDDLIIVGSYAIYNSGKFRLRIRSSWRYADYKAYIVKMRYSNDDQIAIILNQHDSEEDELRYQRMMEWREFASKLARKVIDSL